MGEFLNNHYFGNAVKDYLLALFYFAGAWIACRMLEKVALARLRALAEKTESKLDDFVVALLNKTIVPLFYLGAFYFAVTALTLGASLANLIKAFCVIVLTVQTTRLMIAIALFVIEGNWFQQTQLQSGGAVSKSIVKIIQITIWGLAVVFILDNLGFNVSAVVAGLGIGGIAVAFAAQQILGDLFNYFVIFFDRPFEEGDFVIFDDFRGEIEKIGIKTTRIRSLDGEQIVVANTDLASSRIRNYKKMIKRRVLFKLGVVYQTPLEQLKRIPGMIREIIQHIDKTVLDRAHFKSFGDFSLDIEVVYYVLSGDYNVYMDIQQQINFKIMEAFEKEKIEFAYPTQTVYEWRMSGVGEKID